MELDGWESVTDRPWVLWSFFYTQSYGQHPVGQCSAIRMASQGRIAYQVHGVSKSSKPDIAGGSPYETTAFAHHLVNAGAVWCRGDATIDDNVT